MQLPPLLDFRDQALAGYLAAPALRNAYALQSGAWAAFEAGRLLKRQKFSAPTSCRPTHVRQMRLKTKLGTEMDCNWQNEPLLIPMRA